MRLIDADELLKRTVTANICGTEYQVITDMTIRLAPEIKNKEDYHDKTANRRVERTGKGCNTGSVGIGLRENGA